MGYKVGCCEGIAKAEGKAEGPDVGEFEGVKLGLGEIEGVGEVFGVGVGVGDVAGVEGVAENVGVGDGEGEGGEVSVSRAGLYCSFIEYVCSEIGQGVPPIANKVSLTTATASPLRAVGMEVPMLQLSVSGS